MKKQLYILFLGVGLGVFSSCDSILDVEPTNAIAFDGAITDARSAQRALNGVYSSFQSNNYYGQVYLYYQDLYADNLTFAGTFTTHIEVRNRVLNPSNLQIASTWATIYNAIGRANVVIQSVEGLTSLDQNTRNAIIGEAKFLRALAYFDLVKVFGGVPLVTRPTLLASEVQSQGRSTEAQVYAFIMEDLTQAETQLTAAGQVRATYNASALAASALKARVALQMGNYTMARDKANEVITSGRYALAPTYAAIFAGTGRAGASNESIFELAFNQDDPNALASSSNPATPGQKFYVLPAFFNLMQASAANGDTRFAVSTLAAGTRRRIIKYNDIVQNADNVPVIRLAEMHMIRAEATARLAAPTAAPAPVVVADINAIRTRAGLPVVTLATNAAALQEILEQRRIEFAFEGLRFMDLRRYNLTCTNLGFCPPSGTNTTDNTFRNLWPIPLQQLQTNPNLTQNPGY